MDKARGELGADVKTLGELCQRHGIGIITKDIFIEH
jgi:bifunctional pyridoxal-dependent enzyme with beta-cystathionase and maltose regulon repressor activities